MTPHAHQLFPAGMTAMPLVLGDCDVSFGEPKRGSPWCVLQVLDPRSIFNPQTCGWIWSKLLLSGTEISAGTLLPKAEDSDYLASLCASRVPDSQTTELHLGSKLLKCQSHLSWAGKPWIETHLIFMQKTPTSRFVQSLINFTLKRLKIWIHYLNELVYTEAAMNICLLLPSQSNALATWKAAFTLGKHDDSLGNLLLVPREDP